MRISLTDEQSEALVDIMQAAYEDQQHYLQNGAPEKDYAGEWDGVRHVKACRFLLVAKVAKKLGATGQQAQWEALAGEIDVICAQCRMAIGTEEYSQTKDGAYFHGRCWEN